MNPLRLLAVTLCAALLAVPSRADDSKKSPESARRFEVEVVKDLAYNDTTDADEKQKLDLYLPKGQKDFPVLFFVHGGTWKSGDRKQYDKLGELYASRGLGMVIISYRLTRPLAPQVTVDRGSLGMPIISFRLPPTVQHPAHIQDVARAFSWTCANIGKYGGRADRIFCCGHSAGGHLVSLLATDESYLKAEKRSFADVKGVISISGVYTIVPAGALASAFGKDPEVCKKASPISNVTGNHPPFLLLYGDADFLTLDWMAEKMGQALEKAKCDVCTKKIDNRNHYTIMYDQLRDEDPTRQAILDFVKKHSEKK